MRGWLRHVLRCPAGAADLFDEDLIQQMKAVVEVPESGDSKKRKAPAPAKSSQQMDLMSMLKAGTAKK